MDVVVGRYRHYKGGEYDVIGVAKHSEMPGEVVIYRDKEGQLWARPTVKFFQTVKVDETYVPRFELIR